MANILDLPRDQFLASLNELAAQGVNTDDLRRQYRRKNSIFAPIFDWASGSEQAIADQGRTPAGMGLLSKEAGTTGMDALRSVQLEPSNFIAGLLAGGAQAVDAPAAAAQGLIPAQDMPMEALNVAGTAQLGGAAMAAPRGSLRAGALRTAEDIFADVMDKYSDVKLDIYGSPERGFTIGRIEVPEGQRNSGIGSNVMREVLDRADQVGAQVNLTPSDAFGGNVNRLRDFYRNLGFVENRGRNKDFSTRETMYRAPQDATLSANRDATTGAIGAAASDFGRNWSDRYHWTRSNDFIDEFNPDISTSAMSQLGPHIGTKAAAEARMLAFPNDVGQMLNLRADLNKPFFNPRTNQPWSEVGLESYISDMSDYYGVDRRSVAPLIRRDLAAEGYTDIPYINDVEDAGSVSNIMLVDRPESSDAVLRYQDALFDPLNRTSPNLNAANASPLAGILAMPNEEERNRQLGLLFGGY